MQEHRTVKPKPDGWGITWPPVGSFPWPRSAAMIDRLVHHAEILALKGDSYRLKDRDLARPTAATTPETA